jgi:AraC-like DNA-binding protein
MATTPQNLPSAWFSMRHLQHLIARGEALGLPFDDLLTEAGITRGQIANSEASVPLSALDSMLAALTVRYDDPLLGLHAAHAIQPATLGALGHLMQTCDTFADALAMLTRYSRLLSNISRSTVTMKPGSVEVSWECLYGSALLRRHATEYVFGAVTNLLRLLLPEKKHLLQAVHFAHPRPDRVGIERKYFDFFKCPVHFDRSASSLLLPSDVLQMRLHHGDALMKNMLERYAEDLLRQREQTSSLADEVRGLIRAMIVDGTPSKTHVAAQLGLSSRSLHRRLQELGTGYRELLDEVRLENARTQLGEGRESVTRIAERLGFQSRQAFLRWFKLTSGQTPGEYRAARGVQEPT